MVPTPVEKLTRFNKIASASRKNMQVAIDLVLVHNQKRTKGKQVQISLNQAMVLTATSTWERFVADTQYAFTATASQFVPEEKLSSVRGAFSAAAEAGLRKSTACTAYLGQWEARVGANWAGRRITRTELLQGGVPGVKSGLTLSQHLDQWMELRNGLAHRQIETLAKRGQSQTAWDRHTQQLKLKHCDPYISASGQRFVLWNSDAGEATLQAGAARLAVATIAQVLDYVIYEIADHNQWDPESLRMPEEWFNGSLPSKYRGLKMEDQDYKTLWGGMSLHRHS